MMRTLARSEPSLLLAATSKADRLFFANEAFAVLAGRPLQDLVGARLSAVLHVRDAGRSHPHLLVLGNGEGGLGCRATRACGKHFDLLMGVSQGLPSPSIDRLAESAEPGTSAGPAATASFAQRLRSLSPQESRVLALIATGMPTKAIARRMHRSARTIDNHRRVLRRKLGASGAAELVRKAVLATALPPLAAPADAGGKRRPSPAAKPTTAPDPEDFYRLAARRAVLQGLADLDLEILRLLAEDLSARDLALQTGLSRATLQRRCEALTSQFCLDHVDELRELALILYLTGAL